MQSKLNPYISFDGNARQAMEFYQTVFSGELTLSTFGEAGMTDHGVQPDGIMHASLITPNGITLMASDAATGMREYVAGTNMSMSLSGDNEAELTDYYNKLADGGKVEQPLTKAPWGDTFGMCIDKFGIFWMVNITGPTA
ncbi:MAG TPA: VOC family protein [Candidatus Microsaccharimonas sp.]|nr:VOC family protein [Candidatus Microsaccharimonas sp.]